MQRKEVIIDALNHRQPAYVPWNIELTEDFAEKVKRERNCADPESYFENHG